MLDPVTYRISKSHWTLTVWAVVGCGGILACSYWVYAAGADDDWSFLGVMACAFVAVFAYAVYVRPLRYELSEVGLRRIGLLPEKTIRWDRVKQITITHPDEIRLEQHDGTAFSLPANILEDGRQLKSLVLELAAGAPLKELRATSLTWGILQHLPLYGAAGGAGALVFLLAGLPGFVLWGCGWGVAMALMILLNVRSWKAGKKPKWPVTGVLVPFVTIPTLSAMSREELPGLLAIGAIYSGILFTGCLLLIPFRLRLMEFVERDSSHPPADEPAQEPG